MKKTMQAVQLVVRPDGFTPRTFAWEGERVRVISVESVETFGAERRYRVHTRRGRFELSLYTDVERWFIRRSPTRLGQALSRWQDTPRYALPAWRRRMRRERVRTSSGGSHADGFVVV